VSILSVDLFQIAIDHGAKLDDLDPFDGGGKVVEDGGGTGFQCELAVGLRLARGLSALFVTSAGA